MQYGALKTRFKSILNRRDCSDAQVTAFIGLGQARCARELRGTPTMERFLAVDTSAAAVTDIQVPTDWQKTIAFTRDDYLLDYLDIGRFVRDRSVGNAYCYTRKNGRFYFKDAIPQGSVAELSYYADQDGTLALDTDETPVARDAPDLLIFASLVYAAEEFIDDRKADWSSAYGVLLDELKSAGLDAETPATMGHAYHFDDGTY